MVDEFSNILDLKEKKAQSVAMNTVEQKQAASRKRLAAQESEFAMCVNAMSSIAWRIVRFSSPQNVTPVVESPIVRKIITKCCTGPWWHHACFKFMCCWNLVCRARKSWWMSSPTSLHSMAAAITQLLRRNMLLGGAEEDQDWHYHH
jgi:hypothetical protein